MKIYKYLAVSTILLFPHVVYASQTDLKCSTIEINSIRNLAISESRKSKIIDSIKHAIDEAQEGEKKNENTIITVNRNPLTDYAVILPHTTQPKLCLFEKVILEAYLDKPKNTNMMYVLAYYHVNKSLLSENNQVSPGSALKHTIIAEYFLSRIGEFGAESSWTTRTLTKIQKRLNKLFSIENNIDLDERRDSYLYFIESFNYKEQNRYLALDKMLNDVMVNPNNVFTMFGLTTGNWWIAGESDYADPTTLYNFLLVGYFSQQAINYSHKLELLWEQAPAPNKRFRLVRLLGGFSTLARRWLALFHQEQLALKLIDDEHREWRLIQRAFHSWTIGVAFFEYDTNTQEFQDGLFAWSDALPHCQEVYIRTCSNRPRLSHNFMGFLLGYVDYFLKVGNTAAAAAVLSSRFNGTPEVADYGTWDLGRDAWEHREKNLLEISALYQNNDPNDDPMQLFLQKHKWGSSTASCQICHQAQSTIWTETEKNTIWLPPEEIRSIGVWPKFSTTWYGSLIDAK